MEKVILNGPDGSELKKDLISSENTMYVVESNYKVVNDNNEPVEIPNNCILNFQGGKFYNGKIKFTNTLLMGEVIIPCEIEGTIKNKEVYVRWFYEEHYANGIWYSRLNSIIDFLNLQPNIEVIFDSGVYRLLSNAIIWRHVKMLPGSFIWTSNNITQPAPEFLIFHGGFDAGLYYCLDTDIQIRFHNTMQIYPQWFGACGIKGRDSSVALKRAFHACRGAGGADPNPDADYGCSKIYIPRGYYECNNVDVYANCLVEGELSMATNGSCIIQKSPDAPALRIHCKNYNVMLVDVKNERGEVIGQEYKIVPTNLNYGIGTFSRIVFKSLVNASNETSQPIIKFLSPQQSDQIFGGPGVAYSPIGFTDFNFETCWFQYAYSSCIYVDNTLLDMQLIDCTFDVVTRGLYFTGSSDVMLRCINTQFYSNQWGAIRANNTGSLWISIKDSWFRGCGIHSSEFIKDRFAIHIEESTSNGPRKLYLDNCKFEEYVQNNSDGTKYEYKGGLRLFVDDFSVNNCEFKNLDRRGFDERQYCKFMEVYAKDIKLTNNIFFVGLLGDYTTARIIGILNKNAQIRNIIIANNIFRNMQTSRLNSFIWGYQITSQSVISNNTFSGNYLYHIEGFPG